MTLAYDPSAPPPLSPEQISIAVEILSVYGTFVNIGSLKATQYSLRRLTRSELSNVLELMCVPPTSQFCIGQLHTSRTTRVWYKAPPELITRTACEFYRIDLNTYSKFFYAPERVPHWVKEPEVWKVAMCARNPYNQRIQNPPNRYTFYCDGLKTEVLESYEHLID